MGKPAPKVAVIGAGPGGLAAAILLGASGLDVTVYEKHGRVGGRTSAITEEGFRFDLGPTFFLYPRILSEIYEVAGFNLHAEVPMVKLDPQYHLVFGGGGDLLCTPDIERMVGCVENICSQDSKNFRRFLDENKTKLEKFRPCLESPFLGWRDVASRKLLALLPLLKPWKSLDSELQRYFKDPRLRLAFSFQSKYLGMSPFRCPSLFSILAYLEYEAGVWHPIGGCNAVSESMARVARQVGVRIRTATPVHEIVCEGRRAVGVRTDDGVERTDSVVINADFAQAMIKLVPNAVRRRWTDAKIARKQFSCSTFMMYLGLEGRYDHVSHHTIYTAKDYHRNLDEIERRHVLSDDPSFYVQNACVTDESLAPAGMSTLYVLVPVTHQHRNVDWSVETPRYRQLALQQLRKIGIENVESRIRFEKIVTPDDWQSTYEVYRGATFSLKHNLQQLLHLRPRNRFEDLDSVYLVGGGTHPGSGLPVIYESARISSRLLLEDLGREACWPQAGSEPTPLTQVA